jgi:hypothetical protein
MLRKDVFGLSFATRFRITIIFQRAKTLLRILGMFNVLTLVLLGIELTVCVELMALKSVVMNVAVVFELVLQAVVVHSRSGCMAVTKFSSNFRTLLPRRIYYSEATYHQGGSCTYGERET